MKNNHFLGLYAATILILAAPGAQAELNFVRDRNVTVMEHSGSDYQPMHVGAFSVTPGLDLSIDSNDNIFYALTNRVSDTSYVLTPTIDIRSNWSRHQLSFSSGYSHSNFSGNSSENSDTGHIGAGARLDVVDGSNIFGALDSSRNFEPRFDPSSPRSAAKPVHYDLLQSSLGFVKEFNRLKFEGSANYKKYDYFDVKALDGSTISQQDRDYHSNDITGRADYAVSSDTSIFASYTHNSRNYRLTAQNRNSSGYESRVGINLDLAQLVRGEIAVGYLNQKYKNSSFKTAKGGLFAAKIDYLPTETTTVTARVGKTINETPNLSASGYIFSYDGLGVDHSVTQQLIVSANYDHNESKYNGVSRKDINDFEAVSIRYSMTSHSTVSAKVYHSDLKSNGTGSIPNYHDNGVRVGLGYKF